MEFRSVIGEPRLVKVCVKCVRAEVKTSFVGACRSFMGVYGSFVGFSKDFLVRTPRNLKTALVQRSVVQTASLASNTQKVLPCSFKQLRHP